MCDYCINSFIKPSDQTRENISFEGSGTVAYRNHQNFLFNPERSGFAEAVEITGTNVPFVVITQMLSTLPTWLLVIVKVLGSLIPTEQILS